MSGTFLATHIFLNNEVLSVPFLIEDWVIYQLGINIFSLISELPVLLIALFLLLILLMGSLSIAYWAWSALISFFDI